MGMVVILGNGLEWTVGRGRVHLNSSVLSVDRCDAAVELTVFT